MVRANGDSMVNVGINGGDLLVIDRSLTPKYGDVFVIALGG
ncbi:S24 family peptidase [uncultured Microbulbifer sp.]|nr:S24 family peptidase [uncultured Microbulbifer sp.]